MKRLIYSSIASEDVTFNSVGDILTHAVRKNKENGVTGIMVYDGYYFIQCIEGEETIIDDLYKKITEDTRHHSLCIIGTEIDENRMFSNWNMGYMNNGHEIKKIIENVTGHETFTQKTLSYSHAKLILLQLSFII